MSSSPEGPTAEADNGSVVADVDLKRVGSLSVVTQFLSAAKYACFGVFFSRVFFKYNSSPYYIF